MLVTLLTEFLTAGPMQEIEKHYSHMKNHHRAAVLSGISLPGYEQAASPDALWQIDFVGVIGRKNAIRLRRPRVRRTSRINYESAEALYRDAEAHEKLLPFI